MIAAHPSPAPHRAPPRGLGLVEVMISVLVVSVMLSAALSTVAASGRTQRVTAEESRARGLVESLMSEIEAAAYDDPDGTTTWGPDGGESTDTRAAFDDVDDFHGWDASPPQSRGGAQLPAFEGWRREVIVKQAHLNRPKDDAGYETGLKRIVVTVSRNGLVRASRTVFRGAAYRTSEPEVLNPPADAPPVAAIRVKDTAGPAPHVVSINGTASFDPEGGRLAYRWDFGDGTTSASAVPLHKYGVAGTYTVTLVVIDESGQAAEDIAVIEVQPAP